MKLNVKQTVYIGCAFLTTMMLWQVYNWMVPLYLNEFLSSLFSGDKFIVGIIMALDNLFAIFMIPLMSNLSDKTRTRLGRRTPFIIVGIILSAVAFSFLPFAKASGNILIMMFNILLVLIFMNIYRSPCVALMPDLTPKENRSKANSIINIMGGVGVAIGYGSIIFLSPLSDFAPFFLVSTVMILCLVVFLVKIKENKLIEEYQQEKKRLSESTEGVEEEKGEAKKTDKRSIFLTLLTVLFVYMAINAVETFMSLYSEDIFKVGKVLDMAIDPGALVIIPFGVSTFVFAVPAAVLSHKYGRRNVVLVGEIILAISYSIIGLFGLFTGFSFWLLLFFFIAGGGFALVIINIYPMVLKYCTSENTGKYTGYYYTASMLGQSLTPALCGLFLSGIMFNTMRALFPYSVVFLFLAIFATLGVKPTPEEKN